MKNIFKAFEKFAAKENALEWDNTGILIDCNKNFNNKILLTIDLTEEVLDEAISENINFIISYHPVIFHKLKNINDPIYIKLIRNNISVFCPHTQIDNLIIDYVKNLVKNKSLLEIINLFKKELNTKILRVALENKDLNKIYENVNIGPGSYFKNIEFKESLIITGEMGHHDLLKSKRNKNFVILLEHSNSERLFLKQLKNILEKELKGYEIFISEKDKDPIDFI